MSKKVDFATALKKKAPEVEPAAAEAPAAKPGRPPSRRGTKHIGAHVDPAVVRQLKEIIARKDTTIQALICRGLNMVFHEEGLPTIAKEERQWKNT